jgi:hypothetical protein
MWVELAKLQRGDDPVLVATGRFRRIDSGTELVLSEITRRDGTPYEGHWGFTFASGGRVLADYPTEHDARAALLDAAGPMAFTVQGTDSVPSEKPSRAPRKPRTQAVSDQESAG